MSGTGYTSEVIALQGTAGTYHSTGSSAINLTCPTGLDASTLLVAIVTNATNGSGASITGAPAGWTAPDTTINPNGGMATNMYYKLVGSDTPGTTSYSWSTTATTRNSGVIQGFSGPWGLGPIDNNGADHGANSGTATTTATFPAVSSHNARAALIGGVGWRNGTSGLTNNSLSVGTTGFTKIAEAQSGATGNVNGVATLLWQTLTGALPSSTATMNNSSQYGTFLWGIIPTPLGPLVVPVAGTFASFGAF